MLEQQLPVHVRIDADSGSDQLCCDDCGHDSLRVAEITDANGTGRGSVLLCAECQGRHRNNDRL